jgi:K+-transporting ATPase ATPase C chain
MLAHLRANLTLLVLSLLLCCVLYPLALWAVGRSLFPKQAQGSLVEGPDGVPVGSRLIAQPFSGDEYFQPRPSAASYNAAASGASNYAANNPLLRDRVARQLGPMVAYKKNGPTTVQKDIESWFARKTRQKPGWLADWASENPSIAANWAKSDDLIRAYVLRWADDHPEVLANWRKEHPNPADKPKPEDVAVDFFASYAKVHPRTWPSIVEGTKPDGEKEKKVEPATEGADVQAAFFDLWLRDNPNAALEEVPADLVITSGSGLDPHITLKGALYQLDRVAGAWAARTGADESKIRPTIEQLLREKQVAPLAGWVGVPLVNVLEVNLELKARMERFAPSQGT